MTDDRERWALILGASSGMGEATSLALAAAGYHIAGIHLDFRAGLTHAEEVKAGIGRRAGPRGGRPAESSSAVGRVRAAIRAGPQPSGA